MELILSQLSGSEMIEIEINKMILLLSNYVKLNGYSQRMFLSTIKEIN